MCRRRNPHLQSRESYNASKYIVGGVNGRMDIGQTPSRGMWVPSEFARGRIVGSAIQLARRPAPSGHNHDSTPLFIRPSSPPRTSIKSWSDPAYTGVLQVLPGPRILRSRLAHRPHLAGFPPLPGIRPPPNYSLPNIASWAYRNLPPESLRWFPLLDFISIVFSNMYRSSIGYGRIPQAIPLSSLQAAADPMP